MTTNGSNESESAAQTEVDHFAYYSLAVQAVISVVVLILSFWLVATPTEPAVNTTAFNLIVFITGVWLGRGVDRGIARLRSK
jgi:hypothetical protein